MNINDLTYKVIGCAYKVHNTFGPGFLEKVYENALIIELKRHSIHARQQVKLPVMYEGQQVGLYFPIFGSTINSLSRSKQFVLSPQNTS